MSRFDTTRPGLKHMQINSFARGYLRIQLDNGIKIEVGPKDELIIFDEHDSFELGLTEPGDQETGHLQIRTNKLGEHTRRADGSDVLHYYP
jgi:hypothetical protein